MRRQMAMIDKVGGIIIKNKKVLVVRKKTKENFPEFIIPGGKRETGETDVETLQREIQEEVNLKVVKAEYVDEYEDIAIFEKVPIVVKVYLCEVEGEVNVDNEIKEFCWIDKDYKKNGIKVASILEKFVLPELIRRKLI